MRLPRPLGRYLLLDRLAIGGMAELFRARVVDEDGRARLVVVKRILGHLAADPNFIRMLLDEAKLTRRLHHDNIARVYDFGQEGDEYFIAMEYVDGKDARALIDHQRARGAPVEPTHAAWIGMEVALALHAAHTLADDQGTALGLVHRDISPSNILLSYSGEVKLCDFGIAKATTSRMHTRTGVIKGKVKYMSPEQAAGKKLDQRSDLFSLGSVLYELLTLASPFAGATEVEMIFAVRDAKKRDACEVNPGVPPALNEILNRLLMRSRSQRFQTAAELAEALGAYLDSSTPRYRRSRFSRFMRREFAVEIEQQLRRQEELILEEQSGSRSLPVALASAAGHDGDLHEEPTCVFGREPRPSAADLHSEATRIKSIAPITKRRATVEGKRPVQGQPTAPTKPERRKTR